MEILKKLKFLQYLFLFYTLLVFCSVNIIGQNNTWQKVLNNNYGTLRKITQTSDGGFAAVGYESINTITKVYLIKFDVWGNILWNKIIGLGYSQGYWLEETNDRGFILAGHTDSGLVDSKFYLVKTDSAGNTLWEKTYSNSDLDQAYCVKQTIDGGYIIIGRTSLQNIGALLIKTDFLGNLEIQKIYHSTTENKLIRDIIQYQDCYFAIGNCSTGSMEDVYIAKLNLNLDTIWTKKFGGNKNDIGYSIDKINQTQFILGGASNSFSSNNLFQSTVYKMDTNGNILWQKIFSGQGYDICSSIRYKNNFGFIMAGSSDSLNNLTYKAKLRYLDINGNLLLENSLLPNTRGAGFESVNIASDNGFIASGYITTQNGVEKMYVVKTDSILFTQPIGLNIQSTNIPNDFNLKQNFPNPFNTVTNIIFDITVSVNVKFQIFNSAGVTVNQIDLGNLKPGSYKFIWNANNYSSGIYFCKIIAGKLTKTIKMILLK